MPALACQYMVTMVLCVYKHNTMLFLPFCFIYCLLLFQDYGWLDLSKFKRIHCEERIHQRKNILTLCYDVMTTAEELATICVALKPYSSPKCHNFDHVLGFISVVLKAKSYMTIFNHPSHFAHYSIVLVVFIKGY